MHRAVAVTFSPGVQLSHADMMTIDYLYYDMTLSMEVRYRSLVMD